VTMRCARHPYEGGPGVCAPCLRGRLLALAAAQNEASSLPPPEPEPELLFPRSVSPYVCRRKSDASAPRGRPPGGLLFFRTPQVGPAYGGGGGAGFEEGDIGFRRRRRSGRFSVLAALFGHRSSEKDRDGGGKERRHRPSWLAGMLQRGRRRKEAATASPPPYPPRRSWRGASDRGLSPVRYADGYGDESASPAESPWLPSPSPSLLRQTSGRRRLGLGALGGGVSGFAVCVSPLVRPGLGRHLRGGHPPDAVSSELRPSPLHPLTSSASLHHCRSWKLADGGRFR